MAMAVRMRLAGRVGFAMVVVMMFIMHMRMLVL